ncbi:hypothetical protein IEQ34_010843 [Dendrobium chrysotoxum]|uniref:Uncharacterized protein n=1 Tax=Dendrobium chrysotoxum TaxID=161865 RepID=A0AAV7GVS6_DENCH|nr:hypothetical protein IEQ34_010843 [Dendrobium chrysotoxum]
MAKPMIKERSKVSRTRGLRTTKSHGRLIGSPRIIRRVVPSTGLHCWNYKEYRLPPSAFIVRILRTFVHPRLRRDRVGGLLLRETSKVDRDLFLHVFEKSQEFPLMRGQEQARVQDMHSLLRLDQRDQRPWVLRCHTACLDKVKTFLATERSHCLKWYIVISYLKDATTRYLRQQKILDSSYDIPLTSIAMIGSFFMFRISALPCQDYHKNDELEHLHPSNQNNLHKTRRSSRNIRASRSKTHQSRNQFMNQAERYITIVSLSKCSTLDEDQSLEALWNAQTNIARQMEQHIGIRALVFANSDLHRKWSIFFPAIDAHD